MLVLTLTRRRGEMKEEEKGKIRKWAMAALLLWCLCEVSAPTEMVEKVMKAMDEPDEFIHGWFWWWKKEEKNFLRSEILDSNSDHVGYDSAIKDFVNKALEKAPRRDTSQRFWFKLLLVHHVSWHSSSSSYSSSLQMLILLRVPTDIKAQNHCVKLLMEFIQQKIIFREGHPIFSHGKYEGCKIFILIVDPHDKDRNPEFLRSHFMNDDIDVLSILKTKATDLHPTSPIILLD